MTAASGSNNSYTYRFSSIAMSTLVASPIILGCTYLLVTAQKAPNESVQALIFFFGVPLFVAWSFLATMLVYARRYHQNWQLRTYITAALIASSVSVPLEWLLVYITSQPPTAPDNLDLWIINLGACLLAIAITWIIFRSKPTPSEPPLGQF